MELPSKILGAQSGAQNRVKFGGERRVDDDRAMTDDRLALPAVADALLELVEPRPVHQREQLRRRVDGQGGRRRRRGTRAGADRLGDAGCVLA